MAEKKAKEPALETDIARLEEIVAALESEGTSLEKSIDLYAEGHRIGRRALKRLDGLERRIEIVAREGQDGSLETVDFEEEEE